MKPKKGTAEVIAPFDSKEEAVEALMLASNAMQNSKQQSITYVETKSSSNGNKTERPATRFQDTPPQSMGGQKSESSKWLVALFGAIIVIGLYYYLTTLIPENITGIETQNTANTISSDPTSSTGVPVSADDF